MEIKTPPPSDFEVVLNDEDVCALVFMAGGELELDDIRGQRFHSAPLAEAVFDSVVDWLNEWPGMQMVRYGDWRLFLTQIDEGVIFAERLPRMLLTLEDLFHLGWFDSHQMPDLLDALSQSSFTRLLGVPLWAKTQLAVAISNSLKTRYRSILGPGPWNTYEVDDEEWGRVIAAKAAAGAECLVTASGHLAVQAVQSGLKALWASHPGHVDEKVKLSGWPILDLSLWRNAQGQLKVATGMQGSGQFVAPQAHGHVSPPVNSAPQPPQEVATNIPPQEEVPSVVAQVSAAAVCPPEDWSSTKLDDAPGWELGEPPEPGQAIEAGLPSDMMPQVSDISLEPPPDIE